ATAADAGVADAPAAADGPSTGADASAAAAKDGGNPDVQPDVASDDAAGACSGTVTFRLKANGGVYCVGSQCSSNWLTVSTMSGAPVGTAPLCGVRCSTCVAIPCPPLPCFIPQPLPAGGATMTWDGTNWTQSTCGAQLSCAQQQCAPPGHYVARMCASPAVVNGLTSMQCSLDPPPTCVDV